MNRSRLQQQRREHLRWAAGASLIGGVLAAIAVFAAMIPAIGSSAFIVASGAVAAFLTAAMELRLARRCRRARLNSITDSINS